MTPSAPPVALHDPDDWLRLPLPAALGGDGRGLAECNRVLSRLAGAAPGQAWEALPHLAHVGAATRVAADGDRSLDWLLRAAARGERFSDEIREPGNDVPLFHAAATAEPVDDGFRFSGDLLPCHGGAPVRFHGIRGIDLSHRGTPRIVHALASIDEAPCTGQRGHRRLHGVFVPDDRVIRIVAPGIAGADPWLLEFFTWMLLGEAAISRGVLSRLVDLTLAAVRQRSSVALSRTRMIHHPATQAALAEMLITADSLGPQLDGLTSATRRAACPAAEWVAAVLATRDRAAASVRRSAELALDLLGIDGTSPESPAGEFVREATVGRAGRADGALARELLAKVALGIDPDEQPRWG